MSSDEAHTCPICLEPIFQPGENSNNSNSNNRYNIGATVPCGHLYHYDCFGSWQAARSNRSVKCPTCNVRTDDFVRLYLDVGSLGGPQCHLADEEDDDISLSSIEESNPSNNNNDDETVICNADDENDRVVLDLTESPQRPKARPLAESSGDKTDDPQRQRNKVSRLVRIAKKFKKQYLQKSAQYKEQYTEKRKLSDKIRKQEGELLAAREQMIKAEETKETLELEMNESRLDLARIRQEKTVLQESYNTVERQKRRAQNELRECHSYYKKELEDAQSKSMSEVQELMEEHPKVVKENRILKQSLAKLEHRNLQLERLHKQLSRRNTNSNSTTNNSMDSGNRKIQKAKNLQKALKELDKAARFPPKATSVNPFQAVPPGSAPPPPPRNPFATAPRPLRPTNASNSNSNNSSSSNTRNNRPPSKVDTGQYSSLASRMMKASQKSKKPPLVQQQQQQQGTNRVGGSTKRSAIAALSLTSQSSKRMKSVSTSRRDLFQRKPY